jgi:hypothetical protein
MTRKSSKIFSKSNEDKLRRDADTRTTPSYANILIPLGPVYRDGLQAITLSVQDSGMEHNVPNVFF